MLKIKSLSRELRDEIIKEVDFQFEKAMRECSTFGDLLTYKPDEFDSNNFLSYIVLALFFTKLTYPFLDILKQWLFSHNTLLSFIDFIDFLHTGHLSIDIFSLSNSLKTSIFFNFLIVHNLPISIIHIK